VHVISVIDSHNTALIGDYVVLGNVPKHMVALSRNVTISVVSLEEDEIGNALVTLRSDGVALYVVLTTLAEGVFHDNAFLLKPGRESKVSRRRH